ncbi:serine protease 41 [Tetranychus urticae]|uniref:serine protease 41 n=1 Tax=Tetranychus urticae TaxID=32264 RepID=UPI00077BA374|nr:serine protease 41 [Tetranychus urticae]XP_025017188.1 serine protease 41 [Tetranychus urticae]
MKIETISPTILSAAIVSIFCVYRSAQYCVTFDFDDPTSRDNFKSLKSTIFQLDNNSTVNIISPGYHIFEHYPDDILCSWILIAPTGSLIKAIYQDFNLEVSFHCALDSLWIFDGKTIDNSTDYQPDYQFCGSLLPEDQIFASSYVNLIFVTDSQRNFRGFNISFQAVDPINAAIHECDFSTQFLCQNGNCLNISLICNGVDDCYDGSDEQPCYPNRDKDDDNKDNRKLICPSQSKGRLSIIGGTASLPDEWPWQVSLRKRSHNHHWNHICGAVLIDYSIVLTAAHCFQSETLDITKYSLAFGQYRLDPDSSETNLTVRYLRKVTIHHDYQLNGVNGKEDDIAIIHLSYPVKNLPNIKPVCIYNWTRFDDLPKFGFVTGWGQGNSDIINILSEVSLQLISGSDCFHYYGNEFFIDTDKIICAGRKEGHKDSCKGDSGGPLVVNKHGVWSLIALVSSGVGCGLPNKPGIYTNIGYYIGWINETIRSIDGR